ncbi:MAG: ribosome biogenesis GTP-binding protein YihA/YsxC [Pseudomonadota bacterium]|nr:ribosome biogenesis GTP-binding protein YihA/YsxC [Pseudomonadota bacterium]
MSASSDGPAASPTAPPVAPAALEFGRWLFQQECRFLLGAVDLDHLPTPAAPEVAFAGRSNVGKSSLVNALTGRKTLARTSNTPGRTRELNFFDLGGRLVMVDLPGYGYAKVPKNVVAAWTETIRLFLVGRVPLRRVFVLIDARHGLKDNDLETLDLLDRSAVSYQVVLTKADKLAASARDTVHGATAARLRKRPAAHPHVRLTSSAKGWGIAALRADIAALAEGGSGAKGIASPDNDG